MFLKWTTNYKGNRNSLHSEIFLRSYYLPQLVGILNNLKLYGNMLFMNLFQD